MRIIGISFVRDHFPVRSTNQLLAKITLSYSIPSSCPVRTDLMHDPLPMHSSVVIKYGAVQEEYILHRFDQYITRLREYNHIEPKEITEFEDKEFHLMAEVRASFKNGKRWVRRRLGLKRNK